MLAENNQATADRIHLKTAGRIIFVPVRLIGWLESAGNYVEVFAGREPQRYVVRDTLSAFENRLERMGFVRIHRSVIVNVTRIREMRRRQNGDYQVTLDNGKELTLSRGYRTNFKRLLQNQLATS